jgi:histidinol-phosphate aminotransferase
VSLTPDFQLDVDAIKRVIDSNTKLIFLCSPNNPTGSLLDRNAMLNLAGDFDGVVVVDEAYIHFSGSESLISQVADHPNLIVLQTFSKAWGLAGLRVGLAYAAKQTISLLNKVKPPYNVSEIAQEAVLRALEHKQKVGEIIQNIIVERKKLAQNLDKFSFVERVYPSDANFLLVRTANADDLYRFLIGKKIVVRNRSTVLLCEGCLRITVGTTTENDALIEALEKYEKGIVH